MSTHYTVYKVTNLINGKIYIGSHKTENPNDSYLGSGKLICNAVKKYGKENFLKEVLYDFDNPFEMFELESKLVTSDFVRDKNTYNMCEGGNGGYGPGVLGGEAFAKKLNEDPLAKERHREQCKLGGATLSRRMEDDPDFRLEMTHKLQENFKKAREARKEKFNLDPSSKEEWASKISKTLSGRTVPEETRKKMSESKKGRPSNTKDKVWITNGYDNTLVNKESDLPDGWRFGKTHKRK